MPHFRLAEGVGFEPTRGLTPLRLLQSRALVHYATLPYSVLLLLFSLLIQKMYKISSRAKVFKTSKTINQNLSLFFAALQRANPFQGRTQITINKVSHGGNERKSIFIKKASSPEGRGRAPQPADGS